MIDWIKATEQVPDVSHNCVLCSKDNDLYIGYFHIGSESWVLYLDTYTTSVKQSKGYITHWAFVNYPTKEV